MYLKLNGKLDAEQERTLKAIAQLINAGLPECDQKSVERVTWDFLCNVLNLMAKKGHNYVGHIETYHRDPLTKWHKKQERHHGSK